MQRVQIRPAFRHGRFFGWRVLAYGGPGPLRAGDIVRRVNGQSIERPEEWMATWNGMQERADLVVELLRAGHHMVLRWRITD